jgi:hypothetical protein
MAEKMYKLNGQLFSEKQIDLLMKMGALDPSKVKNNPASTSLTGTQTGHGPSGGGTSTTQGGLFSDGRIRPERFSALPRPRSFIHTLPLVQSEIFNELTEVLTGQLVDSGTDASGFCGDPPAPGDLKVCAQNRRFGNWLMKTNLNAVPLVGQRLNYSDVPADILNSAPQDNPYIPDVLWQLTDTRNQLGFEFFKLGVSLERSVTKVAWQGSAGANTFAGDGWFAEPAGFDSLVRTGTTDAITGQACAAADSVVETFGADVGGTIADGRDIVEVVGDVYYALNDRAEQVGMGGTRWQIVMGKELFRRLVEVYACSYATYRCQTGRAAGDPVVTDGMQVQNLRTEMMRGEYLLIDGVPVPVIFDEGIVKTRVTASPLVIEADMYFMPTDWAGKPLTYLQYFKMDNPYAMEYAGFTNPDKVKFLNNGLFVVGERSTGLCIEYHFASRMRPILETPFLAGRIDNIRFQYSAQTRSADPATTWNYFNGGTTFRTINGV